MSHRARVIGQLDLLDPHLLDAGLALAFTVWALVQPGALGDPPRTLVLVAMTAALAWRRRAPVAVLTVEVAGVALLPSRLDLPEGLAFLIATYSAALYSDRRVVVAALALAAAAFFFAFGGRVDIPRALVPFALVAPAWLAGTAMRNREQRAEAWAQRADRLQQDRDAALREERARIARELHDVVTHSVSVMVLQSGAARQIMTRDEPRSRALLESVEASGRSALEELRRLLGLLSDQDGAAPLSPQPHVTEIPALVEQVRQTGLRVELSVEGRPRALSGGMTVAAYRIVQEALTNVLKHGDGAPARVMLRWSDAALELVIVDDGPPAAADEYQAPAGRGIAGMRERAAMYGGTLEAHPAPDRGYLVHARIPLEPSA